MTGGTATNLTGSGDPALIWKASAIALYCAVLVALGIIATRRTRDAKDYFAGGKRMGFWAVAFSARATGESAWLLLGLTGMGAAIGVKAFWVVAGEMLGVGGAWILMSRRFKRLTNRYDSITIPDYLESRFRDRSHLLRTIAAAALLVFVPIYVSAQVQATGEAFHSFLGMNFYAGAAVGFAVVLAYITTGGFIAVVWSDVFQGTLMVLGLVALPLIGLALADGPIIGTLQANHPQLLEVAGSAGWTAIGIASIIGLLGIGIGFLGSPQVFVRFISLKSEREIPKGTAVALVWTLLADSGAVCVGLIGRAILVDADLGTNGQEVLPELVGHILPAFLAGIYIAIVLAATMSTIDSLLVVASSAAVRDFYQKIFHPNMTLTSLVKVSRAVTALLAVLAFGLTMVIAGWTRGEGIFWFVIFGWSGIAATFCPTIILSLFWRRMTTAGAAAGMIAGFAGVPIFKFGAPHLPTVGPIFGEIAELAPSFVLSFLVIVGVSLLDRKGQTRVAGFADDLASHPPQTEQPD